MGYGRDMARLHESTFERELADNVGELMAIDLRRQSGDGASESSTAASVLRRCLKENRELRDKYEPLLGELFFLRKWTDAGDMVAAHFVHHHTTFIAESVFYDFVLDGLKRVDCATAESRGQSDASALADIGYRCEIGKIKCTRNSLLSADPQTRSGSAASETVQLLQRLRTFILDVSQAAETEYRNALVQEAAELLTGTSIALLDHHDTTVSSLENLLWIALTIGSRPQLAHAEWLMSASRAVNQCFLKLSKYHEAVKWTDKAGSIVDMLEAVEMRASGTLTADQQHAFDAARQELVVFNLIATCFEKARSVYDEVERSKAARTQSTTTSKNHLPSSARASTAHAKALPAEEDLRKTFHASLETVIDEGVARMKGASAKLEFTLALFELTMSIPDETVDVEFAAETKRNLVHRLTMKALSMTETLRKDDPTMSAFQHNLGGVRRLSHALFRGSRRNDFTVLAKRLVELTVMAEEQLGFTFAPARNDALLLLAVDEWAHINKSAGIGTWEASQALMDMKKASDKIRRAITSLAAPMSTIDKETWKIASTALGYAWRACAVHIAAGLRTSNSSEQVLFASFLDSNGVLKTFVDFFDLVEHWPGSSDDESARLHMLLVLCQAMISLKRYTEAKKLIASGVRALQAQRKCYMRSNKSGIACDVLLQDEGLTLDYDEECAYEMACAESEFWILGCKVAIFEQEETRLKHIDKKRAAYARIGAKFQQQDDDDRFDNLAKALCGADQSRMAVFYITLLSLDDLALSTMQADACFESAHNALAACTSSERKLLHQLTNGALQILSRDDESIIVRSSAGPVQSAWIQVYCKQGITSSITSKDSSYVGTGVMARPRHPVVISGLVANQNYTVGIAFFDKNYNLLDIKTSKCTVATTLSLSCLQAWSYLFHVAIRRGHETMIRRARVFFRAAFLRTDITLASMASTYEGQSQRHCILDIDGEKMRRTPSFMRTSIAEAFLLASSTDTNTGLSDQVTLGPTGYGGTISAQLYSLEICRDLVWNLELALSAGDDSLAIMIGIEAARVTSPFLRMQHPPEFAIAFLSACVLTIVDCLERVSAPLRVHILDVTSEMVFTFCKHIQLRDDKQALSVLLRVLPEQLMTHYPEGDVKILNNIALGHAEATAFLANDRRRGPLNKLTTAQMERFVEKANALLSLRCRVPAPPATVKIKLLQEYLRRKAHECNDGSHMPKELGTTTSLAEILAVAEKSGVEFIYAELVRFRKNDRYLELVGRLARRALDAALFDVAIKILVESFQWTHRRNAFVLHPERASESEKRSWRRKGYYVPKATVGIAPALSNRTSAVTAKRHPAKQARSNTMTVVDDDDNDDDVDDADGDMHAGKTERGTESTPSIDPMTEEEAKRVLQTKLPVVWRRARYRRRLRAILEDESIWRADILCTLGQCLREKAERVADGMDLLKTPSSSELNSESTFTKPSAFAVAFDWSWFQPGVTGTAVPRTVSSATTEQYESGQCEIDTLRIPDILQSYTQACVLSARYSNWIQLNNAARQLWNAHATISRFQVAHSKSYNEYLWRSMALASGALLDMLECAVVVQVTGHGVDRKEHILSAVEGPPTKECLEASAPWVVQSTRHLLRWVDRFGCKQQIDLDLDWVYRFVLLSIHLLGRSMNYERLLVVADRLNMVSHYAYGEFTLLQMLMALKETDRSELDIQAVKHMLMRVEKARVNARNELQKSRQRIVAALGYQAAKHLDSDRFHGSPLKGDGMASVVSAYKVTIEEATRFGDGVLVAKTLAELGDFYFNGGDCGSAGVFWKKSLEVFGKAGDSKGGLKVIDPLFARSAHEEAPKLTVADRFSVACLWGKLGCFNCHTDIDQRTAAFLKMSDELNGVASASLPGTQGFLRAMDEVDRLNSQFGGLDLISDKFTSNAGLIVLILLTASKELLRAGFTQKAFVTIGFADHFIRNYCPSKDNLARLILCRAEMLAKSGFIADALDCFRSVPTGRWLNAQEQRKHLEGVPSAKDTVLSEGGDALRIESKPVIDFDDKLGLFKDSNRLALVSVLKLQLPNNIRSVTDVSFAREFQALRVEMAVDLLAKMKRHGHVFVQRDASPASVDNFHDIDDIVKSVAPAIWDTIHVGIDMILGLRELNGDHCVRDAVDLTRLYMSLAELILIWKEDVIGARQLLNSAACSLGQVLRMAAATLDTHDLRQWLDLNFQRLRLETFTTDQVASTQALKTVYRLSQRFASSQHQLRCHILALENGLNLGDANPSLYGDKPVARVIIAEYLEAIGDFHWRSGELSAASSIYNNALDERERHAADSLRIFLKLEHGALSWDRASTMAKICRLSRKTGSNSRFPLPPVDALLDEVGILPLALARWSLEEETAANGNISKHWDRLFMMHVNTLGYDSEGIEEMLLSYLKVCSSSVGVELRSAIVYALACVCRASRALKSSAFTIATDIQTVIAAAPLGIRAAVMASGCAKNVPPPAELWDILSANADAVRSALAKMQSVDVHADEVVASFLKLSNVSRRDMNLLDVTTAALELHRSQLHRYLCETSSTYAEQCQTGLKPSPLEKILPVGVDILAIVWHRHGEDATLCQGTVVVVNSLSATPYEPKIVDFDAASADIADVLHESQQLLQSLCGGGVAVDVNDLFEKIVRRAQMIFRCGPGVSKMSVNVERMTKTLEAFKLFFDTSSAAHIVHGTEASLLYDLVFK